MAEAGSTAPPGLRIVHLVDVPEATATLVDWFTAEWRPWYGPRGDGDAATDLAACRSRNALPLCLVALDGDDTVLGTAGLRAESVGSELGVGPWLAAVLVGPAHRGHSIGKALVAAIEAEARRLGFRAIYTSTEAPEPTMARHGWHAIAPTQSLRGPITVYRRDLPTGNAFE
ncbi:MAG: GNAT family N-acetyltransferase [Alphaproteobacteria bacterium]|jgi:GNAT superfamily N-acetyltransferase|nr:GNAT family N-acetyltransferase [Alphaproteobacteria bacterium]